MRIAVLRNPRSARNKSCSPPQVPSGIRAIALEREADLAETLVELRDDGIDFLVIDGGDGTVRETVSLLPEIFGEAMPVLGIMAHGNTNLVARNCGRVRGYASLTALVERPAQDLRARCRPVPLLRIDGLGCGQRKTVRGFIAGWGAYAAGTRIAAEEIATRGGQQVVRAVLAVIRRVTMGRDAARLRAGATVSFAPGGRERIEGAGFAGIVTVLQGRLVAGLSPFWDEGDDREGDIRWLYISAPPRRLLLAAPAVAFGRPMGWMRREGYRSGQAGQIELAVEGGLVIDGEVFPTRADCPLQITAAEVVQVAAV